MPISKVHIHIVLIFTVTDTSENNYIGKEAQLTILKTLLGHLELEVNFHNKIPGCVFS